MPVWPRLRWAFCGQNGCRCRVGKAEEEAFSFEQGASRPVGIDVGRACRGALLIRGWIKTTDWQRACSGPQISGGFVAR